MSLAIPHQLADLGTKWRAKADQLRPITAYETRTDMTLTELALTAGALAAQQTLLTCADELAAALLAGGEQSGEAIFREVEEFCGWWHLNREGSVNRTYDHIDKLTKRFTDALQAAERLAGGDGPPPPQTHPVEVACSSDTHRWAVEADAEGDTCQCGEWYRFADRIEGTPTP